MSLHLFCAVTHTPARFADGSAGPWGNDQAIPIDGPPPAACTLKRLGCAPVARRS